MSRSQSAVAMMPSVDDAAVGRTLYALRIRSEIGQEELAARAKLSQSTISRGELGQLDGMTLRSIRAHARALGASAAIDLRWRGADLARVRDERHAELVAILVARLQARGWQVSVEVTYSEYGERGSIDVLAVEPTSRACIVCEVKTDLVSIEGTLRKLDEKARLAGTLVRRRLGWTATAIARVLVMAEHSTSRRQLALHDRVVSSVLPLRSRALHGRLREPNGSVGGVWLLSPTRRPGERRDGRSRRRIRARIRPAAEGSGTVAVADGTP